nr:extracellular solute-binding protein [uncultured Acetatifactor sp.]
MSGRRVWGVYRRSAVRAVAVLVAAMAAILTGCGENDYGLDRKDPQTITIWNYYNGAQAVAFERLVDEFNNTVGAEKGILVVAESKNSVSELYQALDDAVNRKAGADDLPDIFQTYLDNAVALDEKDILVDLGKYVSGKEQEEYVDSYVQEGYFGGDDAWKLFPVAKSTEVMLLNKTDWDRFAAGAGDVSLEDLATVEGLAAVAEKYYEWSGGKSFFGRDAFANYMFAGSAQLGAEIYTVENGQVTLTFDKDVTRKLWDNYYAPYVKGYFKHVGKYRSDDITLGEIIAQVCSSSSASYFPTEVTRDGESYPIEHLVLPVPRFAEGKGYIVQQGACMAVTRSTERREYASVVFLRWLTETDRNLEFALNSGYLPVKKEANDVQKLQDYQTQSGHQMEELQVDIITCAFGELQENIPYTTAGFPGADSLRNLLGEAMIGQAMADRAEILAASPEEAARLLEQYLGDAHFEEWYASVRLQLEEICGR